MDCYLCGARVQVLVGGLCKSCYGDPVVGFDDGVDVKEMRISEVVALNVSREAG